MFHVMLAIGETICFMLCVSVAYNMLICNHLQALSCEVLLLIFQCIRDKLYSHIALLTFNSLNRFGKRVFGLITCLQYCIWSVQCTQHVQQDRIILQQKREAWLASQGRDQNNHVVLIGRIHTDVVDKCCRLWQHAYTPIKQSRLCAKTDSTMKNISLIKSCISPLNVWSATQMSCLYTVSFTFIQFMSCRSLQQVTWLQILQNVINRSVGVSFSV